jgi:hypothetical protein
MFKLGFLTSPETSLKQVFLEFLLPIFLAWFQVLEIFIE